MQLTKPQSVYVDIRSGSGRKRKRQALTVYVDRNVEDATVEVARLVRQAVEHGSTPAQEVESSMTGDQSDSDRAVPNEQQGSEQGPVE